MENKEIFEEIKKGSIIFGAVITDHTKYYRTKKRGL